MLGVVLCGGQSSRMGSDKGLLKLEANTWAQTAIDKIATLKIPVKISVNNGQHPAYAAVFPSTDLIIDDTTLSLKGPLLGVLSVIYNFRRRSVYPCLRYAADGTNLMHTLYTHYQQEPSFTMPIFLRMMANPSLYVVFIKQKGYPLSWICYFPAT